MGKKMMCWTMSLLASGAMSAVELVKDGKAYAEIVVDKDANSCVKLAAEDLQYHLERISGVKLEVVNKPSGEVNNQIYVGSNKYTDKLGYRLPKFNNSGYDILVKDNYIILDGPCMFFPEEKKWTEEEFHKFMGENYKTLL